MSRRPPPPPPIVDSEPEPPKLPPRPGHAGKQNIDDVDETYEQPSPDITSRGGNMTSFFSSLRISAAENSDSEGWSESEWEDSSKLDAGSASPPDDNTYLMPEGAMDPDEYNLPDDTKVAPLKKPQNKAVPLLEKPKTVANDPISDKTSKFRFKIPPEPNKPKPPPSKPVPLDKLISKPVPPLKPKYPPVKVLPKVPTVDSQSDDNASTGSVSRELESKVHHTSPSLPNNHQKCRVLVYPPAHENIKLKNRAIIKEKQDTGRGQENTFHPVDSEPPIYDDGMSEDLSQYDWYHGELERDEGMRRIEQSSERWESTNKNGTFLIRASKTKSPNNSHPYTLVVTLDRKVYNLKIRLRADNRFAIGNYKSDEVSFPTVPELVDYHKENNIKLAEGGSVKLTRTPKK